MDWTDALNLVIERTGHRRYAELCADDHADHLLWRQRMIERATGEAPTPVTYPGLFRQAANLAGAVTRVVGTVVHGEQVIVPTDVYADRLVICEGCDRFDPGPRRCKHVGCGCFMDTKARLATERCPLDPPKWNTWEKPTGSP